MSTYSVEIVRRVYNDEHGTYIEVSPDADGLDLIEIRQVETPPTIYARVTMTHEQARLVAQQLLSATLAPEVSRAD